MDLLNKWNSAITNYSDLSLLRKAVSEMEGLRSSETNLQDQFCGRLCFYTRLGSTDLD